MRDFRDAKAMAQTLRDSLTTKAVTISHSECLELVSRMLGAADWNTLSALLQADRRPEATLPPARPVARERIQAARYPAVPVRDYVPLPVSFFPLFIGREKTKAALDQAFKSRREVVLVVQKDAGVGEPGPEDVHGIGVLAQLIETEQMEDGSLKVMVEAGRRVAVRRFVADAGSFQADVEDAGEGPVVDAPELVESALRRFALYAETNDIRMPKGWPPPEHARDPGRLADVIAANIALWPKDRQAVLAALDPVARLRRVHDLLGSPSIPLSPAFDVTRRRAMASATRRGHRYSTLEHLLLALIDDADASAVLRMCNADLEALKVDLLNFLGSERENIFVEPGAEARPTPAFQRVGQRAQLNARELGHAAVTGANVLVGLFPETRSPAARLLDKQGVSPAQVADVVAQGIGKGG
ncbi:MAG TPA: LON peptidase substrate-binding domain-containing protein [Reyranella sp.]|jgi:ATP-dependent Lon protease|nr:LON peptidase substrate-binding domain-containing protein [Reyranella sp.]